MSSGRASRQRVVGSTYAWPDIDTIVSIFRS